MKSTTFLLFFLFWTPIVLFGQPEDLQLDWAKTFGKGTDDIAYSVIEDTDGNYLVAGVTEPKGSRSKDIDVLKLSPSGKLIWGKKYGKSGDDITKCIVEAHEGGYVLAGNSSHRGKKNWLLGVIKLNKSGDQVWTNTYDNYHGAAANALIRTFDGGYLVVGNTQNLQSDALVVKFNARGNVEWDRTYGGDKDDKASAVIQLSDGGYAIAGKTYSKGHGGYDLWILKIDSRGRQIHDLVFGGYKNEMATGIARTRDGNYLVVGNTETQSNGSMDIWLLKLGKRGNLIWDKTFGSSSLDWANCVTKAPGGYLIGGYTKAIAESKRMWVLKVDEYGSLIWDHEFKGRSHSKFKKRKEGTEVTSIATTKDGGYVVAGNTGLFLMNKLILKFKHEGDKGFELEEEPEISFKREGPPTDNSTQNDFPSNKEPAYEDPIVDQSVDSKPIDDEPVIKISDVDINIPVTHFDNENTYALIIGNEDYTTFQPGLQSEVNVDFAENDARIFHEYCTRTLGIPERNINLLINATYGQMIQAIAKLEKLAEVSEGKAQLLFYYAGHGLPHEETKEAYLMPVDISGTNLESGIKLDDLYSKLSKHKTKRVTVFLDACFSGAGRNQGLLAMRGVKIRARKAQPIKGDMVVFSSSTGTESSGPLNEQSHGLFTYFILKKLQETRGNCSYGELADYLREKVRLESILANSKEQTPEIQVSKDAEDVWADWKF